MSRELVILKAEKACIAAVEAIFGKTLREVESAPAEWSLDDLKRKVVLTPGIYVSFLGGADPRPGGTLPAINGSWAFTVLTAHAGDEQLRREGDKREIGAYEIVQGLVAGLHGEVLDGFGSLIFQRVENLFTDAADRVGVSAYAVYFSLPMSFPPDFDLSSLADFKTFDGTVDLGAPGNRPPTPIREQLPQS
jgi:phage gp37-like protein